MESQPLAVVVLAAGLGKRMVSQHPKVLHPLAGLPLVAHVLRALAPLAPSRTVLVVGHEAEQVQEALGHNYGDGNLPLEYASQSEQLGTGHAVLMAAPMMREHHGPVLVMYGDTPLLRTETVSALLGRHRQMGAFLTMLTCIASDPTGYGRVLRDQNGNLLGVVEERAATLVQRAISEVNSGVYLFEADWLWSHLDMVEMNAQGEYYLTDLVGIAIEEERVRRPVRSDGTRRGPSGVVTFTLEGLDEAMGINSRNQLAQAESMVQASLREKWMDAGVTMLLPDSVYLGVDVIIGPDSIIYPGVVLEGKTMIGSRCTLGHNCFIADSRIGDDCRIVASTVEGSTLENGVTVGPYSHLRAGTHLGRGAHLGNYVEVKASTLGAGVRMGHFGYIGDATVGEDTNIGAGTITANYDGEKKNTTTIGKGAFIGVDTSMVAPVEVGDGARTGAGSVVTKDVPPHSLAVGVPARVIKTGLGTEE
jgi:bifunctional UDP-N-acetylglucosamine pyrophosphorylase/glucosamine-1-phosphate N-acetyltransferase